MSTQSNLTTASEDFSMVDVSNVIETSMMHKFESPGAKKVIKGAKQGTKSRKAAPKSRGQTAATQQEETVMGSSFVEPEDDDFEVKILSGPIYNGGGKKRKSDEMSVDNESTQAGLTQFPLPSPKRRATSASASHENKDPISTLEFTLDNDSYKEDNESMVQPSQAKGKKTAKGGRKRASSSVRKASTTSTATKASLRAAVPDDEQIDAALEAELDRPLTDDEEELEPPPLPKTKTRRLTKTRPGSRKATASTAPVRKTTRARTLLVEGDGMMNADTPMGNSHIEASQGTEALEIALNAVEHAKQEIIAETDKRTASKAKTRGRPPSKATKAIKEGERKKSSEVDAPPLQGVVTEPNAKSQEPTAPEDIQKSDEVPAGPSPTPEVPTVNNVEVGVAEIDSSVLAPPTSYDDCANETGAVAKSQTRVRGGGKTRANTAAKKSKVTKKAPPDVFEPEHVIPVEVENSRRDRPGPVVELEHKDPVVETTLPNQPMVEEIPHSVENVPKPIKGRLAKAKARPGKPSMKSPFMEPKEPAEPSPTAPQNKVDIAEDIPDETHDHAYAISPQAATPHKTAPPVQGTPKTVMSPQSSDAENQPPSSRPSALRPPLTTQSPSKGQTTRVVLAAMTPTASPSKQNTSRLESTLPWTSTDFEKLFTVSPAAEKEDFPSTMGKNAMEVLTSPEKKLTVEEWIQFNAQRGEDKLRDECERLVGRFEGEGVRALKTLEGILCAE
ncbi:MAG: hypothetical protein LQ337_001301 [Flavoplaca oasis]|nr:MAG: hypothetical protein LQ337_001301 [Flavoplaca oasis]